MCVKYDVCYVYVMYTIQDIHQMLCILGICSWGVYITYILPPYIDTCRHILICNIMYVQTINIQVRLAVPQLGQAVSSHASSADAKSGGSDGCGVEGKGKEEEDGEAERVGDGKGEKKGGEKEEGNGRIEGREERHTRKLSVCVEDGVTAGVLGYVIEKDGAGSSRSNTYRVRRNGVMCEESMEEGGRERGNSQVRAGGGEDDALALCQDWALQPDGQRVV